MEILELKTILYMKIKMLKKKLLGGITELEDRSVDIIQSKEQRKK